MSELDHFGEGRKPNPGLHDEYLPDDEADRQETAARRKLQERIPVGRGGSRSRMDVSSRERSVSPQKAKPSNLTAEKIEEDEEAKKARESADFEKRMDEIL